MVPKEPQGRGLARVNEIYQDRSKRVKELKETGKKIIGYLCSFPPVEMMTAADLVPYRITGDVRKSIDQATNYLIPRSCPFTLNCFELGIKGEYEFLDGFVSPYSCEYIDSIYDFWCYYFKPSYHYYVEVPHRVDPLAHQFFKEGLARFRKSLEEFSGIALSDERLRHAIKLHNENRALMRELYQLRKEDPPLISGTEITRVILAAMSIPVTESNEMLRSIIEEVKDRRVRPQKKSARLLLWGPILDDIAFVQLIEESGAHVVMDDVCFGSRHYWSDVEIDLEPIDGLATRYLQIPCPCIYRGTKVEHREDLEYRFRYLLHYARDFNVNGAVLCVVRHCETHAHNAPDIRDYLKGAGLPVLHMDYTYDMMSAMPLKTRVQAFVEMIG